MKVVAVLCTYNEAANLPELFSKLKQSLPDARILVADDDSPDRTADVAKKLGAEVLLRKNLPRGRGLAGKEGYALAIVLGADAVLEMDADGSHDPKEAPRLLDALQKADIAVGSRASGIGGGDERGLIRRIVSGVAKVFLKMILGLPLGDPTSGYRAFRADALKKIIKGGLRATGPEIVEEVYVRAYKLGLTMAEVPIVFKNRASGESKLTLAKLARVFWRCLWMPKK